MRHLEVKLKMDRLEKVIVPHLIVVTAALSVVVVNLHPGFPPHCRSFHKLKCEIKIMWDIFSDLDFDMPSVEEIEPTIKLLDLDGSGKINYEEFMKRFNFELFPGLECLGFD